MKKFAFFATVLMVLASCSNTDELMGTGTSGTQSAKQAITFESPFVNKNTRGSGEITNNSITHVEPLIWGFSYTAENQPGTVVIGSENESKTEAFGALLSYNHDGGAWTYENKAYWDPALNYDFLSVVNGLQTSGNDAYVSTDANVSGNTLTINEIPFVQKYSNESSSTISSDSPRDIVIAAVNNRSGATGGSVQLNYKHLLSRLDVYAYSQEGKASVTLTSLKLYLPSSKLNYDYNVGIHSKNVIENGTWQKISSSDYLHDFELQDDASSVDATILEEKGYEAYELVGESGSFTVLSAASAMAVTQDESKYLCPVGFYVAPVVPTLNDGVYLEASYTKSGSSEVIKVPLTKIVELGTFDPAHYNKLILRINGDGKEPITFTTEVGSWETNTKDKTDVTE